MGTDDRPLPDIQLKKLLGQRPIYDARDYAYLARRRINTVPPPPNIAVNFYQPGILPLDQGFTSSCVAHGWTAAILLGPISQGTKVFTPEEILRLYHRMLEIDEYPGTEDKGTSTRAGAKVFQEEGYITEYVWGQTALDAQHWMQSTKRQDNPFGGPVIVGVNWYRHMFNTDGDGYLSIPDGDDVIGGHEVVLCGYSPARNAFRGLNSWGRWGHHEEGLFWMTSSMLNRLMSEHGDMCMPTEIRLKK